MTCIFIKIVDHEGHPLHNSPPLTPAATAAQGPRLAEPSYAG